jgi:hypothetical protein
VPHLNWFETIAVVEVWNHGNRRNHHRGCLKPCSDILGWFWTF